MDLSLAKGSEKRQHRGRQTRFAIGSAAMLLAISARGQTAISRSLEDECWQRAEPLTNFTQVLPVQGAAPSERTELRFAYTRDVLFIAIRCFARAPRAVLAKAMQRDNPFDSDDYVKIAFDTFARQRDGYVFMVNPAGARTDSIFGRFSGENRDFDAIWDARARIVSDGWVAEIAIPFKSISFDPRHDFWRMNIEREECDGPGRLRRITGPARAAAGTRV